MLGSDKVATAAYVGKLFKDYDELKMAFLQGHDWLSTLVAEYHEAYKMEQNIHKVRYDTELKQLKMMHEESMKKLDRTNRTTFMKQQSALSDKYQTDIRVVQKKFHDHRTYNHKQCLQRLARPPPQEVLPDYSLMDND